MNKQTLEAAIAAITALKGPNFNVALLLVSGHRLAGKVFLPVGNQGFVRIDVTRIEGANLRDGPVPSWVNLEAIQVVALD
jgi:hypothetical protein